MNRIFCLATALIFGLLSIPGLSHADIYMKRKRHTDAIKIMGTNQPEEHVVEKIWITKKGFRSDNPKNSIIMLSDQHKVIMMDHSKKTYFERDLDAVGMEANITKNKDPEKTATMKGMMKNMMKMEARVQPTDKKQIINGWHCRKYLLTMKTFMGEIHNEVWATEDLKAAPALYDQLVDSMVSIMPDMENSMKGIQAEIKKIKGVQVKVISTQNIMGRIRKSVTELVTFEKTSAPKDIFEIPKSYTEQIPKKQLSRAAMSGFSGEAAPVSHKKVE